MSRPRTAAVLFGCEAGIGVLVIASGIWLSFGHGTTLDGLLTIVAGLGLVAWGLWGVVRVRKLQPRNPAAESETSAE